MWRELKRVTKRNAAIVLFGSQPFTSALVMSNPGMFRYEWVWDKTNRYTGFANSKRMPLKRHENICVFAREGPNYYPQMGKGEPYVATYTPGKRLTSDGYLGSNSLKQTFTVDNPGIRWPCSVLEIEGLVRTEEGLHPTQKPLALLEYLILTYTNPGDTVLDFTFGSCTTGVACLKTGRKFVGCEQESNYCEIGVARVKEAGLQRTLFSYDMTDIGKSDYQERSPLAQMQMLDMDECDVRE